MRKREKKKEYFDVTRKFYLCIYGAEYKAAFAASLMFFYFFKTYRVAFIILVIIIKKISYVLYSTFLIQS